MSDWADKIASQWCNRFTEENFQISEALRKAKVSGMMEAAKLIHEPAGGYDESTWRFLLAEEIRAAASKPRNPH